MERLYNFIEDDLISVDSVIDKDNIIPVSEELNRGGKIYVDRLINKKMRRKEVKPLYDDSRKKKNEFSKLATYRFYCTFPKRPSTFETEYPKCDHKGNIVIDRDILPQGEHDALLAQPKIRPVPVQPKKGRCRYEKRFLPNCTAHLEDLALPRRRKIMMTLKTYGNILSPKRIDFLSELLKRDNKELRTVAKTIELYREEGNNKHARKMKIRKEAARLKRKLKNEQRHRVRDIVYTIYELMQQFLTTDHKIKMTAGASNLSDVLECRIKAFLGIPQPCGLESKFIKMLSNNLALWMEKFLLNFGFDSICATLPPPSKPCACVESELRCQIPIDDYLELSEEEEEDKENYKESSDYATDTNKEWLDDIEEEEIDAEEGVMQSPEEGDVQDQEEEEEGEGEI